MHRFLLFAIISTFIFCGPLKAQRGRILKRLRDDIFGTQPSEKERNKAKKDKPTAADAKQPTLADSPRKAPERTNSRYQNNSLKKQLTRNGSPKGFGKDVKKQGFGMSVKLNSDDQLIVDRVDPSGNAAQAGIRRGDHILEIGGMEATAVEEFDEIAKIMSPGDQLELRYQRGSQKEKILMQYGAAPKPAEENIREPGSAIDQDVASPKSNYDFAPPRQDSNTGRPLRSVLDSEPAAPSAIGAGFSSRQQLDSLQSTVQTQQQTIRQLQGEVLQLRRALQGRR